MDRRWFAPLVGLLLVLAFAAWVWPTRWRFDHMSVEGNIVPIRVDRISGRADMLIPDEGWVPVEAPPDSIGDATPAGT